ncbi:MAG: hypothetical protein JST54_15055 [Deltaproteobacteria bacterium]|nr:hypothetical protein [Deltaproteobacteria bacterium]
MADAPSGFTLARDPDEVPTPLAIAAADFCRRAGRPSSPEAVRLALARLSPDEDSELEALLQAEPEAKPLGPEALVDVVRGLSAQEAAEREERGEYVAMARVPRRKEKSPAARRERESAHPSRDEQRQEVLAALAASHGDLERTAKKLGLSTEALEQRLKRLSLVRRAHAMSQTGSKGARPPHVRPGGAKPERVRPSAPVPPPLPKRGADRPPKGRLVLGTPAHRELRELESQAGAAELRELLKTYKGNRRQIIGSLNRVFRSTKKWGPEELDVLLARHGLRAEAERQELDNLRYLFTQARGELGEVAKKLKVTPADLRKDLEARGLWAEAERLRDRFRRELFGKPLGEQVRLLLTRGRYLRELGAQEALERHVREEVERQWLTARDAPSKERVAKLASRLAIGEDVAESLVARFKLGGP